MVISPALALIVPQRNHIDWLVRVNGRKGGGTVVGKWVKLLPKPFPGCKDGIRPKSIEQMVKKTRVCYPPGFNGCWSGTELVQA